jgi:tellurium resistance protein TerD
MKNIQLPSEIIVGLDWTEKSGVQAVLRVVPINVHNAAETANIVTADGKTKAYPYPQGRVGNNALFYSEHPWGNMPGAIKAMIKIQFGGIPQSIVSKLIFVLTAADENAGPLPIKQIKCVPMWCARPENPMDNKGLNGRLAELDLAGNFPDGSCAVPLELVRSGDDWIMNVLDDGCKIYAEVLEECGIKVPKPPPPPPPQPSQPQGKPAPAPTPPQPQRTPISGDAKKLITGQRIEVPADAKRITVTLEADARFRPDMSAFILDGQTQPKAIAEQLIFYNQPNGAGDAVRYDASSNSLDFDLERIPQDIVRVAIVLSIDEAGRNLGQANRLTATFKSQNSILFVYEPDVKGHPHTAVVMCEVYRHKDQWKFNAKGAGVSGGLAQLCADYGVDIE